MIDFLYNYFAGKKKVEQVEDANIKNVIITVKFKDGYEVGLSVDDIIGEYIRLRLMYHATFDRPDIIPYLGSDFYYNISAK